MKIYKTTRKVNTDRNIEVAVDRTNHILVKAVHITLPATTTNICRDVQLRRRDETQLGIEKNQYLTSQRSQVHFTDDFILPKYDPILVVDTATCVLSTDAISIEVVYEEVKL